MSRSPPKRSLCRTRSPPRPRWCFGDHNNPAPPNAASTAPGGEPGAEQGREQNRGHLPYPQVFLAAGKRALSGFPSTADDDGAGPKAGSVPGRCQGRSEGDALYWGRGLRRGALKARPPRRCRRRSLRPVCVCVCLCSRPQFLLRHSHGADGESLPAGQGGDGPRDPPLHPAASLSLPGHLRPRRRALPGAAAGRAAARLPHALQG